MKRDRLVITKEMIPYSFNILLADELFTLGVNYNEKHDFFTVSLAKNGETKCEGEPIIYGRPLFSDLYQAGEFPCIDIIPIDGSGRNDKVTFENFNDTVFLTVDNVGGDDNE